MKKRSFVFGLISAISLVVASGVFWSTNLPSIEVVGDSVRVVHCEPPLPKYAKGVCPKLYCKKAVLESAEYSVDGEIGFQKTNGDEIENIFGALRYQNQDTSYVVRRFQCVMDGYKVVQLNWPE
ncbi:MAG: hypothetical protein ABW096_08770 [Candidatus Thiodiazotropha sp.]